MEILKKEMQEKRKEFEKVLVFSLLGIFLFYIILPYALKFFFPNYKMLTNTKLMVSFFIGFGYLSFLISKTKYDFIILYRIMVITFFILVFYLSLILCNKSSAIYFYYIPLLLMLLIVYDIRVTTISTITIIILTLFTPTIATQLGISKPMPMSQDNLKILKVFEVVIIFFSSYISLIILYYFNEFHKIQVNSNSTNHDSIENNNYSSLDSITNSSNVKVKTASLQNDDEKFENLYSEIINLLDNEKLYQDPNFNKKELAYRLKTNDTYISKAINNKGNKTFNCLINDYRIKQVLSEFNNKGYHRTTIENIYKQAGFTQQSTFNRVFKGYTGKTPSEFIEQFQNK